VGVGDAAAAAAAGEETEGEEAEEGIGGAQKVGIQIQTRVVVK
jgi:hypothetical protein